jgi:predicted membrane protein
MPEYLTGRFSWYWLYYFSKDGILRVRILSGRRWIGLLGLGFLIAAIFSLLIALLTIIYKLIPFTLGYLLILAAVVGALGTPSIYRSFKIKRLSKLTLEQAGKNLSAVKIPWSDVKSVKLRRQSMMIETENRTYQVWMKDPDEEVSAFMKPLVGDRMTD